jgi:hypothetical protein
MTGEERQNSLYFAAFIRFHLHYSILVSFSVSIPLKTAAT